MERRIGRGVRAVAAVAVATAVGLTPGGRSTVGAQEGVVVASGLASPRHLTFSPTGALYVVEAGAGGARGPSGNCADHPLGEFCLGSSGAVTQVSDAGPETTVLSGLPSIASERRSARSVRHQHHRQQEVRAQHRHRRQPRLPRGVRRRRRRSSARSSSGKLGDGTWAAVRRRAGERGDRQPRAGRTSTATRSASSARASPTSIADAGGNAIVRANHQGRVHDAGRAAGVPSSFGFPADAGADLGGPRPRRRVLHQPARRLPVRCRRVSSDLAAGARARRRRSTPAA